MLEVSVVKQNFINYINKLIENKSLSHAYLIEVDDYQDDLKYIYDFIKMILCNCYYQEINNNNKICTLIDSNNYPDIKIIEPDGSWIKKNQLLELQKEYSNKSLLDGKRIYIIKNAEKLNLSSANTILKFLEEPEENIIAFLLTDNRYHIIDTILSRCQILSLKENDFRVEKKNEIMDLIECVINPEKFFLQYNFFVNGILEDKKETKELLSEMELVFINYLNNKYNSNFEEEKDLFKLLKNISDIEILRYISIIEEEVVKLDFNVNYKLWLDSLFSKLIGGKIND